MDLRRILSWLNGLGLASTSRNQGSSLADESDALSLARPYTQWRPYAEAATALIDWQAEARQTEDIREESVCLVCC
jgi:hypothetical protein